MTSSRRQSSFVKALVLPLLFRTAIAVAVSTSFVQRAIDPTASGQIGVNPVVSDLGPMQQYVGLIGANTGILRDQDGSTVWIGKSDFITETVVTITLSNVPTTKTSKLQLVASTATSDGEGQKKGDIALTFGPILRQKLETLAAEAVEACRLVKKMKRDYGSEAFTQCLSQYAATNSGSGGPFAEELIDLEALDIPIPKAIELEYDALVAALAIAKTQARLRGYLILKIAIGSYAATKTVNYVWNLLSKPEGLVTPAATPTDPCPAGAPTGSEAPVCRSDDCQGLPNDLKCTTGKWKDCSCLAVEQVLINTWFNMDFLDQQQGYLSALAELPEPTPECSLLRGSEDWEGNPFFFPSEWCVCEGDDWKTSTYPTVPSATDDPCAYNSLPITTLQTTQITPFATTSVKVTSCNKYAIDTPSSYVGCTCNDNKQYLLATITGGGRPPVETCMDAVKLTTAPPEVLSAEPTATPMPYYHEGPPVTKSVGTGGSVTCLTPLNPIWETRYWMSREAAVQAINSICDTLSDKFKFGKGGNTNYIDGKQQYIIMDAKLMDVGAVFYSIGSSKGANCASLDFGSKDGRDNCKKRFMNTVDLCDTVKPKRFVRWKQGGLFSADCIDVQMVRCDFRKSPDCQWK
ncbi:hypothetical protein BU16DRAFT_554139 [Lophium mytilinum]|uniref:Uncharacterized protein n=1 Tax=Lophium mytilinum TaxID=390894 RepID=A0A6A6RC88_9PEZI|nr:hypothetical protein BU16DRAFT_554139 [Lophium mytilinum]